MRSEVLLLNADATPVSWLPLSSISWQTAIRLIWLEVVDVLHTYKDWEVHSPSMTMPVPSVLMLRAQVRNVRLWAAPRKGVQPSLVFLRDMYICQYCGKQYPRGRLTIDHVLPRYYGGKTRYDNVTTACSRCNEQRGCNQRIQPLSRPYRPTFAQLLRNMRQFPIQVPDHNWIPYLGWQADQVRISSQHVGLHENFDNGSSQSLLSRKQFS